LPSAIGGAGRLGELGCAEAFVAFGVCTVDQISVSALVALLSKMSGGATGKAGDELFDSLSSTVRRLFGRRSTSVEAAKRLGERPGDADAISALAHALVDDSGRDAQAAAELRHWLAAAEQTLGAYGQVSNTMDGDAPGGILRRRGDVTF
jgi:hypothetical protein